MDKINLSKIFDELFPINRSILGPGYIKSLNIVKRYINFSLLKYKSGKRIFDWVVPKEWHIVDAYINYKNRKIIDMKKNNLHVVNYSEKVDKLLNLKKLNEHLYSLPKQPKHIPYVTSYYKERWGFCLPHEKRKKLKKGIYHCFINSKFSNGYLVNGLSTLKGKSNKINLISTYLCHPSLANNELSGPLVMIGLFNRIKQWKSRNFTYMFLVNPETIGSLCFLYSHGKKLIKHLNSGLILTCLGGSEKKLSYKLSKNCNSTLDKLFLYLNKSKKIKIRKFSPSSGSDERQYNSPGFNLPVGNICRSVYGEYPQYHNSSDNKKFMDINKIYETINSLDNFLKINDKLLPLKRAIPFGEVMLSKRNLYDNLNFTGKSSKKNNKEIIQNILCYADGKKNILDIVKERNLNLNESLIILEKCVQKKIISYKC
tara:strand:+ start:42 stop:1325 length:1284 start_codon:yes stop_codon:yes gene_type:complete